MKLCRGLNLWLTDQCLFCETVIPVQVYILNIAGANVLHMTVFNGCHLSLYFAILMPAVGSLYIFDICSFMVWLHIMFPMVLNMFLSVNNVHGPDLSYFCCSLTHQTPLQKGPLLLPTPTCIQDEILYWPIIFTDCYITPVLILKTWCWLT